MAPALALALALAWPLILARALPACEDAIEEDVILEKITLFNDKHSAIDIVFFYKYPLSDNSKIEFGYDGRIIDNKSNMSFLESVLFDEDIIGDIDDYIDN